MLKKTFMKMAADANFIRLFGHNLQRYRHIDIGFDLGYTARGINYAKKVLLKWPLVPIS